MRRARIFVCPDCGSRYAETCWRCQIECWGGALVFVVVALVALCL